uniref:ABC transmembrane type-1 domain-containing protein n=1 Tax=Globodera pallida TaxID=36090 RepID=A0A183CBX9_GLOPA
MHVEGDGRVKRLAKGAKRLSDVTTDNDIGYHRLDRKSPCKTPVTSRWAHILCLLRYCVHYWQFLTLAFIFLVIYSVARVFVPLFIARVVSDMVRSSQMRDFLTSILWLSLLTLIVTVAGGIRSGTFNFVTAKINRRMRRDLFRAITVQEIAFFDNAQTGHPNNGLMVLGSVTIMLALSWRLTMVTLILIPPIAVFTKVYSIYYDNLAERSQLTKANANRIAGEVISSMRDVRVFAAERTEQKRFETELDATLRLDGTKSLALIGFQWMTEKQIFAFLLYQLQLGGNFYLLNSVATQLMESVGASRKFYEYLTNGLMVLGSVTIMLALSWRLTMVTLILIPPIAVFTKVYSIYYDHLAERSQLTKANANRIAGEVISSMRDVRVFAAEQTEQKRFETELDATLRLDGTKSLALIVLFYGGYLVLNKQMTEKEIFAFLLYQLQLGGNFYLLNSVATQLMESVGASRKFYEYLTRQPQIPLESGKLWPAPVMGTLEFRSVTFIYPTRPNMTVLKNVSFVVRPGEMVALVGPSGAGKSTVFSLLERFYQPTDGQILLDDIPIERWSHIYFHKKVSLVPQEPTLYSCSIRDNILYGCGNSLGNSDETTMEAVVSAAKLANIHDFVLEETERGYETECGEKGVQLSGGQRQRIAIARALVRQPKVLLLDEATSALDAQNEQLIRESLASCTKGRTVLMIAHRLSTVKRADRILVMDRGQIVQKGNHKELMTQEDGLYYSMVQKQMGEMVDH